MIRKANKADIVCILDIVKDARLQINRLGFKQWLEESNYPNYDTFLNDIKNNSLYVYDIKGKVVGVIAIVKGVNLDYNNIKGLWLSNAKYYTIHRLAVKGDYHNLGIGSKLIEFAKTKAIKDNVNLRIDTHNLNVPMKNLIKKEGFIYCGIITLQDEKIEPLRDAYEIILSKK